MEQQLLPMAGLTKLIRGLFESAGMPEEDARWFAESVVDANLCGIDSHGALRVPAYLERLECGAINPRPALKTTSPAPAAAIVDGDGGAGCIVARRAMELAVERANSFGIGIACAVNSNHFGAASLYSRLAVEAGMVGIAMTNVAPLMGIEGAGERIVGNNPISIAMPTFADYPFVLDMSLSAAAEGKLRLAAEQGSSIPYGWAVDKDGVPTDDPHAALQGFLLPVGGFKGIGLAYAVDMLSGLMAGGAFAGHLRSMYRSPEQPSLTAHCMIAINATAFLGEDALRERMADYRRYIGAVKLADGGSLCFPGEPEHRTAQRRRAEGIPLAAETVRKLTELAKVHNVPVNLS